MNDHVLITGGSRGIGEAVAIRALEMATRRADNAALLATLPDRSLPTDDIVQHVHASRR